MRSSEYQRSLNQLALIAARLNQSMQEAIAPHLSNYLNAVDYNIRTPQKVLAEFLASDDYQLMLTLINDNLGPIVFHDNIAEYPPADNKIHIYLVKDKSDLPIKFCVFPCETLGISFDLEAIAEESTIIRENECTYVDYRNAISSAQQAIQLLMIKSSKDGVVINDHLRELVRLIMAFNRQWGDFIPMTFEFKKTKATAAKLTLKWQEKHETAKMFSAYTDSTIVASFREEGVFKDLITLMISPGRACEITTTCRAQNKDDVRLQAVNSGP